MRCDWNLIREILFEIERREAAPFSTDGLLVGEHTEEQILHHARLLLDGEFIEGQDVSTFGGGGEVLVERLTFEGHDLLNALRSPAVWQETHDRIQQAGGAFVAELVRDVAVSMLHRELLDGSA